MGKSLKGRDLGEGLCQRKDGRYVARFTGKQGKKYEKYFQELAGAKEWLQEARYKDQKDCLVIPQDMMFSEWFTYWLNSIKGPTIKQRTRDIYSEMYEFQIEKRIGAMKIADIKMIHCQNILNRMSDEDYTNTYIKKVKKLVNMILQSAVDNEIISKNPCTLVSCQNLGREPRKIEALTCEEQKKFIDYCQEKNRMYTDIFIFILQTGLRSGEASGLKWSDIDFNKKTIYIQRTLRFDYKQKKWLCSTPKTKGAKRHIPLTDTAITILKNRMKINTFVSLEWREYVFINSNSGEPFVNQIINLAMNDICEILDIKHISMHILRHTFATRCIEGGMKPKTLQQILGHANINITMNLYVHITEEEKQKEIDAISEYLERLA